MIPRLGKLPKKVDRRTLQMADYSPPDIATLALPESLDWSPAVRGGLLTWRWPMYRNDTISLCAVASPAHMIEGWTANVGNQVTLGEDNVVKAYKDISGYDGTEATDTGCAMLDVNNYWRKTGIGGHQIDSFVEVNPQHVYEVKAALAWFGGVSIGLDLPVSAQRQTTWDVVSNDGGLWGGHAVNVVAYSLAGLLVVSWGTLYWMSWEFFLRYCTEAYAIKAKDWFGASGLAPSGFDDASLTEDLAMIPKL